MLWIILKKQKEQIFIDILFIGKPTEVLGKRIINLAKSLNSQIHVQSIQRSPLSIVQYFPLKDPIPKIFQSNIVYKIDCIDCDASYIGKTTRPALRRFQEHDVNLVKPKITKRK